MILLYLLKKYYFNIFSIKKIYLKNIIHRNIKNTPDFLDKKKLSVILYLITKPKNTFYFDFFIIIFFY